jgi:hypothetical protein
MEKNSSRIEINSQVEEEELIFAKLWMHVWRGEDKEELSPHHDLHFYNPMLSHILYRMQHFYHIFSQKS